MTSITSSFTYHGGTRFKEEPNMKTPMTKLMLAAVAATLLCMVQSAWGTTAYVSTYEELSAAIENASVDNIIVTASIDVPCETSGNAGSTDVTGASTAQLIIKRSLTLQSQAGSKYIIKRVVASGATSSALKSLIAIRGNGKGDSGTANLTENTVKVSFKNIIIDGGANWGSASVDDRRTAAADAYGCSGRATIDVYLGATLNLEDGVEVRNGFTTKSDNSLLNDSGTSACFGGAVRVDYHNNTGGGTINVKAGATIHDCTARGGYGGALGAYNYARLNLYGGTIYNCSANHGGAITCTYRSSAGYGDATAGTIRMYGGTISNCCAENGGALCTHGLVEDYVLGGAITSCRATYGGAIYQDFNTTVVHIVDYDSGKLTISDCVNTYETPTSNTDGYNYVYLSSGSISVTPVYQVTFRDNNANFAVLSVVQGTSLGEAFPASPVNADHRFLGWYKDDIQFTSSTAITANTTVTAKWISWDEVNAYVGKVIGADGKMYKTVAAAQNAGTTASGVIAYWGTAGSVESGNSTYRGMAIALEDAVLEWGTHPNHMEYCTSDDHHCSSATPYCSTVQAALNAKNGIAATQSALANNGEGHWHNAAGNGYYVARPSGASMWAIPSVGQWQLMVQGLTGNSSSLSDTDNPDYNYNGNLNDKLLAAGGKGLQWLFYWSSTEQDASYAWCFNVGGINDYRNGSRVSPFAKNYNDEYMHLRMFFAFEDATDAVYTISYDANGGSGAPSAQTKDGGIDLSLSGTTPTRAGYTFAGWNTKADGSGTSYASGATFTGNADTTLYAQWGGYGAWAEDNGITGAWNEKDASGIYNVFRYVFGAPGGAFANPPLIDIALEDGKVVVKTPPVVNSDGVTVSVVESSDVAGETVTATKAVDASGSTEFTKDSTATSRFYRLSAEETE